MTEADRIGREYSNRVGRILGSYENTKGAIRADAGATDAERTDRAFDAHDRYAPEYEAAIRERNARYAEREAEINSELFGAPPGSASGAAFTNALLQARAADDAGLSELANLAAGTGDENLGRAVLAVASQRGDLAHALPYINSSEEVQGLFRELQSIPDAEAREKAARSSLPVPSLEALKPDAQTVMAAERSEAAQRANRRLLG